MRRRSTTIQEFCTIRTEGAVLPSDILLRISTGSIDDLTPSSYGLPSGIKLNEAITQSWARALAHWNEFKESREAIPDHDATGTLTTRQKWLMPMLDLLGFGKLPQEKSPEIDGRTYPIQHRWSHVPFHLLGCKVPIDKRSSGVKGAAASSPHSLVQEFLNRSEDNLWAILTNGLQLRILRDSASLNRQAYVEFDLESMMDGEIYSDFTVLWLVCHVTRFEATKPEECILEKWSKLAVEDGTRILGNLREGVTLAIERLGQGFIGHPANDDLRDALRSGEFSKQDLYRELLRVVYRMLFLFVAEDRDMLFTPSADETSKEVYRRYYSTRRLRFMADRTRGTGHSDLWESLSLVFASLNKSEGCSKLGLTALGSFLWDPDKTPHLNGSHQVTTSNVPSTACTVSIANEKLLGAIRAIAFAEVDKIHRAIDYKHLGAEELGSIYESLLELVPDVVAGQTADTSKFKLRSEAGNERKTSGSFYTPDSLVQCLLDSALEPVVQDRLKGKSTPQEKEEAILSMTVCDPAVGSGHFMIGAAHRLARHLARIRTGDIEPAPEDYQSALRDVIRRCIYGVDLNPMAAELCKVALWMESMEAGKPLSFLDHHIQVGNSLIGATPPLLDGGLPEGPFKTIEGDDKKCVQTLKQRNKQERNDREKGQSTFDFSTQVETDLAGIASSVDDDDDDTLESVQRKAERYLSLTQDPTWRQRKLASDAWCAAFMWIKDGSDLSLKCPTDQDVQQMLKDEFYPEKNTVQIAEIARLAKQYEFFHWHLAYPQVMHWLEQSSSSEADEIKSSGFDVMLGNPPWEHVELKEKEWFATRRREISEAKTGNVRKKLIQNLSIEDNSLFIEFLVAKRMFDCSRHFLSESTKFPLCGRGRVNFYAVFAELFLINIAPRGRSGCVVPTGIATDDTTKYFFQKIMEGKHIVSLFDFENKLQIFFPGVAPPLKFCALTIGGDAWSTEQVQFVFFAYLIEDIQNTNKKFTLSSEEIKLINPNTRTCPIFRSSRDANITKSICSRIPILVEESKPDSGNPWGIRFWQGLFNMTSDSDQFNTKEELEENAWTLDRNTFAKNDKLMLPLYEAKLFHQYNHRLNDFSEVPIKDRFGVKAPARLSSLRTLISPLTSILPRYWVDSICQNMAKAHQQSFFISFRSLVNVSTNRRTLVSTIIPKVGVGNSSPLIILSQTKLNTPLLQANLSSFVCDYCLRQKIGGSNLNYFILKQVPVLPPEKLLVERATIIPRVLELTFVTSDLTSFASECEFDGLPFRWRECRRFQIRCELDAEFFHLYEINRDDVDYIMETFPIVKRKDVTEHGSYRTKERILEIYDEMSECIANGTKWQSPLDPPPGDPRAAWTEEELEMWREGKGDELIEKYGLLEDQTI